MALDDVGHSKLSLYLLEQRQFKYLWRRALRFIGRGVVVMDYILLLSFIMWRHVDTLHHNRP